MKFISSFFRWVFMKKKSITDPKDLYFYHSKRVLVVLILFLAISFLSALTFISLFQSGEMAISVPDVLGKTLVDAQLRLQQDDLFYRIKTKRYPDKPEGIVLEQEPQAGSSTKKMRAVVLFINQPAAEGRLPNLSGLPVDAALSRLKQSSTSNFKPILFRQLFAPSDSIPAGTVISQTPEWGIVHPSPVFVTLLISSGSAASGTKLPSFAGQSVLNALSWLSRNDLAFRIENTPGGQEGVVSSQLPRAGSAVQTGQVVILKSGGTKSYGVLNLHLPQELKLAQLNLQKHTPTINTNSTLSEQEQKALAFREERERQKSLTLSNPAQYKVSIRVREGGATTTLMEGIKKPGDRILITFPYTGTAILDVLINDKLFFTRSYH